MKKTLLILGTFLTSLGTSFGQNYFAISKTGITDSYNFGTAGTVQLTSASGTLNDVLSPSISLPFNFSFYGQTVTSFKASDNGYITFDATAATSIGTQATLPSVAAPKNAIFAFWQDLQMSTLTQGTSSFPAQVQTWTYGTAPNRIFVVQWKVMAPKGATGTTFGYFAIRLYEKGYFDIVHDYGYGSGWSATVGCQDATGTNGYSVTGSPTISYSWSNGNYDGTQARVFEFRYASMANDIVMNNPGISSTNGVFRRSQPTLIKGDALTFTGSINNFGTADIKSYTVNYSVDGGAAVSKNVTTSLTAKGGSEGLNMPTWTVAGAGAFHNIKVWISSVNGSALVDTSSYSANYRVFVINGTNNLPKKTIIEEGSGAWCGYCPDGHLRLKTILDNDPAAIGVVIHNSDAMQTTMGNTINSTFVNGGYPFGSVDRHLFDGQPYVGLDRGSWLADKALQDNTKSVPVKLDILTKTWDPATQTIGFTVTGNFSDYVGGDIRITAYVVENHMRGPHGDPDTVGANAWSQHNYYSSKWASIDPANPLYNEPARINGYFHNHVLRAVLSANALGDPLISAGTNVIATPNQTFSKSYTWKMTTYPTNSSVKVSYAYGTGTNGKGVTDDFYSTAPGDGYNKPDDIKLVAFVSMNNAADPTYDEILNATSAPLFQWNADVQRVVERQVSDFAVYPNPTAGFGQIVYNLGKTADISIDVYNVMGQKVASVLKGNQVMGDHTVNFDMSQLNNGLYFVTINSDGVTTTKEVMVQK